MASGTQPSTPGPLLERLLEDPESGVRYGAAENPSAGVVLLERCAVAEDPGMRMRAAGNAASPRTLLRQLADDPTEWVSEAASLALTDRTLITDLLF